LCVIVAITATRNGIDVIAGKAIKTIETGVSGIGYTTNRSMPSIHRTINKKTLALVKMLRMNVWLTSDEMIVPAKGTSNRTRRAVGVGSSLKKRINMKPNGITASTTMTLTTQKVTTQMIGRRNLMGFDSAPTFELTRRREFK